MMWLNMEAVLMMTPPCSTILGSGLRGKENAITLVFLEALELFQQHVSIG